MRTSAKPVALSVAFRDGLRISADGFSPEYAENADFWHLYLDLGAGGRNRELGVYSHMQKAPRVIGEENGLVIRYDGILAEDKSEYDVVLTLSVKKQDDGSLAFSAELENRSPARINELHYPLFCFSRLCGDMEKDILYRPLGLGEKTINPHDFIKENCHTEYMTADNDVITMADSYPGSISMPWMEITSGEKTLYLGRHDGTCRLTTLLCQTEPREEKKKKLCIGLSSYPALGKGEALCYGGFTLALFSGAWQCGADFYRKWSDEVWNIPHAVKERMRKLCGWQRIILKAQYGEIFHTYRDLPALFREGKKHGIDMLLVFAWWREGMDNGYPAYLPVEALGGAEELRRSIEIINAEGGTVILYANGHLIDVTSDFYKSEGAGCAMKDIEHNEYREAYRFAATGTLLRTFGHKTFVGGCHGTQVWRNKLYEITNRHLSLGSNGTFFDQLGVCIRPCFDVSHEHGARIDLDPDFRIKTLTGISALLGKDDLCGTEWVFDRLSPMLDFVHGCGNGMNYTESSRNFPFLYRYAFPETIISNRFIHDEKAGFRKHLNYAFVMGMIFDVSIYRGRASGFEECAPDYAAAIGKLTEMRNAYLDFFVFGRVLEPEEKLPEKVIAARYQLHDKIIAAICNNGDKESTVFLGGKSVLLKPEEVKVIEL